ncbi:MAG TPA: hypothetical protein VLA42_18850 [Verrucomicrobiae bacterium]|jgi:hypothetical protein|nr:hypothetical protein [Verrucomicrobiae bacterium]
MRSTSIVAMRPNVTQEDAVREFSSRGLSSMYWRMTAGRLQRIADAYVPYQFFEVSYVMARAPQTRLFAMDMVDGSLDLFEFSQLPSRQQLVTRDTRNRVEPSLSAGAADELLRAKALRIVFQQGFFKVREASLHFSRKPDIVHLPYWLGFYALGGIVRCRVMDAVRRRVEGAKASAFFEQWLTA